MTDKFYASSNSYDTEDEALTRARSHIADYGVDVAYLYKAYKVVKPVQPVVEVTDLV